MNVFDKICYRKGACFINQVAYYVGDDVLKQGMKDYFSKYAMKNTLMSDFMECFQKAAKSKNMEVDLEKWMASWLKTGGVNTLSPIIEEKEGCFFISIRQDPSEYGHTDVLREQLIDVATYKLVKQEGVTEDIWEEDGKTKTLMCRLEVDQTVERVLVKSAQITPEILTLESKPEAVLINYNNRGYCRLRFDSDSYALFRDNLRYIKESSMRTYLWRTFKDMAQSNHMSVSDWYKLLIQNLAFEDEEQTLSLILDQVLVTCKNGLFTDEQVREIFSIVSRMELQVVDESGMRKSALVNMFNNSIVMTGLIIDPADVTPEMCYEVIGS